jgi:hypothetical protein
MTTRTRKPHPLPPVGTEFFYTVSRPWGQSQTERETIACTVTKADANGIEYTVTEVLDLQNRCPSYTPATGGGISAAGWDFYMRKDNIHIIEG